MTGRLAWLAAVVGVWVLGLLAKESAVVVPGAVVLYAAMLLLCIAFAVTCARREVP